MFVGVMQMWIGNINFPLEIIEALENRNLVIFAGAGVSMGKPSMLPDFISLAERIAERDLTKQECEHVDSFLGRLTEEGREVKSVAQTILADRESKPTTLHRSIVSLFRSSGIPRIVTTNFDPHFTTIAQEIFTNIDIYYAPALPLGRDFDGVVYLHGSVQKSPSQIIITDVDFGRAYFTDGWATRFLREMFTSYTVLFIGYSHNDPVMKYLARGLPLNSKPRYAISDNSGDWRFLGIEPVLYTKKRSKANAHLSLYQAIEKWATLTNMGALDHEMQIKQIVESTPPLDKESADYVASALEKYYINRFFTRYARSVEWLVWAEQQENFRQLFRSDGEITDIIRNLAHWFADNYVCNFPGEALEVVQRLGQQLNSVLWSNIARKLAYTSPLPDPQWLSKWVAVLLESASSNGEVDYFGYILENCRYPEDIQTAILLFEFLTRPKLKLEQHVSFFEQKKSDVDATIEIKGEYDCLQRVWESFFKPNLGDCYSKLETVLTGQFTQAHLLMMAMGQANEEYDRVSAFRSAIEPHEQDTYPDQFSLMIDAARDSIEYLLKNDLVHVDRIINNWINSGVPILKRLAIHGVVENPTIKADDKLHLILERNLLFGSGMKHEVFRLLAQAYPKSSITMRKYVLDGIMEYSDKVSDKEDLKIRSYEIYNILIWLDKFDPECQLLNRVLNQIRANNPNFRPREYPDFDSWSSGGVWGNESPITVEEIIKKDPKEEIDWLLDYNVTNWMGPSREGLLDITSQAVSRDFDWSWRLVEALEHKQSWTNDLWKKIFYGWQKGKINALGWELILTFLCSSPQLYWLESDIANLLENSVDSGERSQLPLEVLKIAEQLAYIIFSLNSDKNEEIANEGKNWLDLAINRIGGKLALFWVRSLSMKRRNVEEWTGIPAEYKTLFETILITNNENSEMARIVFASQVHFLHALDFDWTNKYVLPLFDTAKNEKQAEQAWHGFGTWGRLSEALVPQLLKSVVKFFPKLGRQPKEICRRICGFLASIALYSIENPIKSGWLIQFIRQGGIDSRKEWARQICIQLSSLDPSAIKELWNSWIKIYWMHRNNGHPLPLIEDEKDQMLRWVLELEPVFTEAVDLACAKPFDSKVDLYWIIHILLEKELVKKYPEDVARLFEYLIMTRTKSFRGDVDNFFNNLIQFSRCKTRLNRICNRLAELGFEQALSWKAMIERIPDEGDFD